MRSEGIIDNGFLALGACITLVRSNSWRFLVDIIKHSRISAKRCKPCRKFSSFVPVGRLYWSCICCIFGPASESYNMVKLINKGPHSGAMFALMILGNVKDLEELPCFVEHWSFGSFILSPQKFSEVRGQNKNGVDIEIFRVSLCLNFSSLGKWVCLLIVSLDRERENFIPVPYCIGK